MSNSKKSLPPIVYVAGALALAGAGYTLYTKLGSNNNLPVPIVSTSNSNDGDRQNSPPKVGFETPTAVPAGTILKIGGATSLAQVNQTLKIAFEKKFPGVRAIPQASSSSQGLTDLAAGSIDNYRDFSRTDGCRKESRLSLRASCQSR